jgi:hypothetical protein
MRVQPQFCNHQMSHMTRTLQLLTLLTAAALATACGSNKESNLLSPTSPSVAMQASNPTSSGATSSTMSLVGNWVSANTFRAEAGTLPASLSQCSNWQLTITSQTATLATGRLTMTCPGDIAVSGAITGRLGGANIPIRYEGTATQYGQNCAFAMDGTGFPLGNDNFRFEYTGTSCLGPIYGTELLRLGTAPAAAPTPAPGPAPTAPAAVDAINLASAIIRDSPASLGSWPITTALRVVDIGPSGVHVEFSKQSGAGRWPDWTPPGWDGGLQYSLGMALNIGGQWYASAPIEYWAGLDRSGGPPSQYAMNWFYNAGRWAPMTGHQPAVGETIGFFVCAGDCRGRVDGSGSPVKERSNVVLVKMPTDAGARYTF